MIAIDEQALSESNERNQAIIRALPDLVFLNNKEGVISTTSPAIRCPASIARRCSWENHPRRFAPELAERLWLASGGSTTRSNLKCSNIRFTQAARRETTKAAVCRGRR